MNKLEMKHQATEIVREATRQSGITQTTQVMNHIPELLGAVEIDSEYIRRRVERELNRRTGNPINALLGLMGLRIVSTRNATETLGLEEKQTFTVGFDKNDSNQESMLKVNRKILADVSGKLTAELAAFEKNSREERQNSRDESSRIFTELDKKIQECAQLNADLAGQRNTVMEHAQYMLTLLGKESSESSIGQQLVEMLEDIGVFVYWSANEAPFSDSAMFTELKCENPEQRHMKPCLVSGEAVLMKGIRFVSKVEE